MIKVLNTTFFFLALFVLSCKKFDAKPESQIKGDWKLKSTNFPGYSAFPPDEPAGECQERIIYRFKNGEYSTILPDFKNCQKGGYDVAMNTLSSPPMLYEIKNDSLFISPNNLVSGSISQSYKFAFEINKNELLLRGYAVGYNEIIIVKLLR